MWELDITNSWAPNNWCLLAVVLKTAESSLDSKEIKPVNLKGKLTLNIHWKDWCWSWSSNTLATWCEELTHWKRPWCWERLRQEEKGMTEDEMVGWHHWLIEYEFEQALGDGEGQRGLVCCSPWGFTELDMTERLYNNSKVTKLVLIRGAAVPHKVGITTLTGSYYYYKSHLKSHETEQKSWHWNPAVYCHFFGFLPTLPCGQ